MMLLNHKYFESIIFLSSWLTIRKYSGGYHAKSFNYCLLIYIFCYLIYYFTMILINPINTIIFYFFSILLSYKVYLLAPVDTANKYISEHNKNRYQEKTRIIIIFWNIISFIMIILNLFDLSYSISMAILFVYILMIMKSKK